MGGCQGDPADPSRRIPVGPGTYVLIARLSAPERLRIGRLGTFDFGVGIYLYVGSALGGLRARIARHMRGGRMHWHIDYLMTHADLHEVWVFESPQRLECRVSEALSRHLPRPIRGFGASDCRCSSHLFYGGAETGAFARIEGVLRDVVGSIGLGRKA